MNIYRIKITEFNEDFVKYRIMGTTDSGMTGRKWFSNPIVNQIYIMKANGARVVSVELEEG